MLHIERCTKAQAKLSGLSGAIMEPSLYRQLSFQSVAETQPQHYNPPYMESQHCDSGDGISEISTAIVGSVRK